MGRCLDKENSVKIVSVKTGLSTANGGWIIDDGLKSGDKVIVSDLMKLRQGMKVTPKFIKTQN